MLPSLLAASDVLGTGWFGAVAAHAGPGKTVAVVGDGAVGLMAVLAAKRLGAERIIAMSRHPERQALAEFYGATDIVEARGDEGVERIKELTNGLGAHSVVEAVGTPEAMMQAIHSTRGGGHMGFVGVPGAVQIPGLELFFAGIHTGRPGPSPPLPSRPHRPRLERRDQPGEGLRPHPAARPGSQRLQGNGRAPRHKGPPDPLIEPTSAPVGEATEGLRPERPARYGSGSVACRVDFRFEADARVLGRR
jgi:Zinc-binding dehydrogenase